LGQLSLLLLLLFAPVAHRRSQGAKDGKGRGRQVIGVARTCNLIMIVLDAGKPMTHKVRDSTGTLLLLRTPRPA